MLLNNCTACGIEWQAQRPDDVCPRCTVTPGERHPLADEPPLSASDIEAIKMTMLATGWLKNN